MFMQIIRKWAFFSSSAALKIMVTNDKFIFFPSIYFMLFAYNKIIVNVNIVH